MTKELVLLVIFSEISPMIFLETIIWKSTNHQQMVLPVLDTFSVHQHLLLLLTNRHREKHQTMLTQNHLLRINHLLHLPLLLLLLLQQLLQVLLLVLVLLQLLNKSNKKRLQLDNQLHQLQQLLLPILLLLLPPPRKPQPQTLLRLVLPTTINNHQIQQLHLLVLSNQVHQKFMFNHNKLLQHQTLQLVHQILQPLQKQHQLLQQHQPHQRLQLLQVLQK